MGYVMVPVPEELENEIQGLVLRLALRDKTNVWDADALAAQYREASEIEQRVLLRVARSSLDSRAISEHRLAFETGLAWNDLLQLVNEINHRSVNRGNPYILIASTSWPTADESDDEQTSSYLTPRGAAHVIRDAAGDAPTDSGAVGGGPSVGPPGSGVVGPPPNDEPNGGAASGTTRGTPLPG